MLCSLFLHISRFRSYYRIKLDSLETVATPKFSLFLSMETSQGLTMECLEQFIPYLWKSVTDNRQVTHLKMVLSVGVVYIPFLFSPKTPILFF